MLTQTSSQPDVAALDARLTGSAFAPSDEGYAEARTGWVMLLEHRPPVVALPETADDIVAVVDFAREHGLRVAPQGTGHNAGPLGSLDDTVLLKTHKMRGVSIDAEAKVARVEAGVEPWRAARPSPDACGTPCSHFTPPPTRALRPSASMDTWWMASVLRRIVPSSEPSGPALWPVRWGATRRPRSRA